MIKRFLISVIVFTLTSLPLFGFHSAGKRDEKRTPEREQPVVLNFDNADIHEVIRTFADILDITYIIDTAVQGKVTIHTAGSLKKSDIFTVFLQILEANGLAAVKDGKLYRLEKLKETPRMALPWRSVETGEKPDKTVIIQIIPLDFISVEEMTKLLTPFVSRDGTIVSHKDSGTIVVVDTRANIAKILRLVDVFDVDVFETVRHRFHILKNIEAGETANTLKQALSNIPEESLKFIPLKRLNAILVLGSDDRAFEKVEKLIKTLDTPVEDIEPKLYVYSVKNGEAEELAETLNRVFSVETQKTETAKRGQKKQTENRTPAHPPIFGSAAKPKKPQAPAKTPAGESGTLRNKFRIIPDEIRNVLIIEAVPGDYRIIEGILQRLDVLPRQVLIEVVIAEIRLDGKMELGVEWSYEKGSGEDIATSLLEASAGSEGLAYVVGQTNRWKAALRALETDNKVNVISSPSVLASDNKEAKINISSEIPVASAQINLNSGSNPITETTIQYRNTGVILTVTPHINEHGLVSMDVSQEVSETREMVPVGNESMPSFFKRTVNTSLTVNNGQTIVIGGLMSESKSREQSGVPCLLGMPVMKYLFGKQTDSGDKTELIIMITPRVIANLDDVDAVTNEFKNKVENVWKDESADGKSDQKTESGKEKEDQL